MIALYIRQVIIVCNPDVLQVRRLAVYRHNLYNKL